MKKFILSAGLAILAMTAYAKDMEQVVFTTNPPMSCQNCENKIKHYLKFEKGVKKIDTNLAEQRITVDYDADKTNPEAIEKAFNKMGYQAEIITSETPKEVTE